MKLPQSFKGEPISMSRKGTPNKRWKPEHDDVLLDFLANVVKNKPEGEKKLKKATFIEAAARVNSECGSSFDRENVEHHLKWLNKKYQQIQKVLALPGARWDNVSQRIVLDKEIYETYTKAHPDAKDILNNPVKNLDLLSLICGDEQAMGTFANSVYKDLGGDDPNVKPVNSDAYDTSFQTMDPNPPEEVERDLSSTANMQSQTPGHEMPRLTGKRVRDESTDHIEMICKEIRNLADAIRATVPIPFHRELYATVMEVGEHHERTLERVFDYLYAHDTLGRAFAAKNLSMRRAWVQRFVNGGE
ncbi:uncharacterized protein [Typha latifolia]|uniref:uncharacterized protein n=1 Tax=Typha latifolia TaxID=4733 RepID=UPI003C2BAF82